MAKTTRPASRLLIFLFMETPPKDPILDTLCDHLIQLMQILTGNLH